MRGCFIYILLFTACQSSPTTPASAQPNAVVYNIDWQEGFGLTHDTLVDSVWQKPVKFYRWCLNKTIQVQDGALAEYTGVPARRYAEKFPIEFFVYMDQDTSGSRYLDWTAAIGYSGFYDQDDYKRTDEVKRAFADKMKQHCRGCSQDWVKRIEKFVGDCFN
jgi:hypothetical protein